MTRNISLLLLGLMLTIAGKSQSKKSHEWNMLLDYPYLNILSYGDSLICDKQYVALFFVEPDGKKVLTAKIIDSTNGIFRSANFSREIIDWSLITNLPATKLKNQIIGIPLREIISYPNKQCPVICERVTVFEIIKSNKEINKLKNIIWLKPEIKYSHISCIKNALEPKHLQAEYKVKQ